MTDLRVSTNAGDELVLGSSDLEALRAKLRGPLLLAGDAGYDEARTIFNAMTDHRPALIACPAAAAASRRCGSRASATSSSRYAAVDTTSAAEPSAMAA